MADCFSLPNAAEFVRQLRNNGNEIDCFECKYECRQCNNGIKDCMIDTAADAIEALMQENAKLKAELDAYVQLFSKTDVWKCPFCAHNRQPHRMAFADCDVAGECKNTDALPTHFELRGVKEADDATD